MNINPGLCSRHIPFPTWIDLIFLCECSSLCLDLSDQECRFAGMKGLFMAAEDTNLSGIPQITRLCHLKPM